MGCKEMLESDREVSGDGRIDRRTMLKGTAVAGLFGVTGVASASNWHEITFMSVSDELFEYSLEVSGEVKRGGTYQSDDGDEVSENTVFGRCAEGRSDSFLFTGERTELELSGPGKVLVDGELIEDTTMDGETGRGSGDDGDDEDGEEGEDGLPKEAIVSSPGTDEFLAYTFEVTGDLVELEPDEDSDRAADEVIDLGDRIRVEGGVNTGDDRFAFSGDLIPIDIPQGVLIEIVER